MEKAVEIKNLNKAFGTKVILNNLNLSVYKNEIVAIVGPSGSGKSTLLNLIGLIDTPDAGEIFIEKTPAPDINSSGATQLRRSTINYIFQSLALINDLTVMKNLELGLHFLKMSKDIKEDMIDNVLKALDIYSLKEMKVFTLSGGEQQRVAAARAIIKPGNLILADEPTGSLDKKLGLQVFDNLVTLAKKYGKTIILVTHDLSIAEKCDRVMDIKEMQS